MLQRYELLFEARLIPEARRGDARRAATPMRAPGRRSMILDHRRILATGIARLRAKIKYHPVVFELMPETSRCCSCSAASRRWPDGWFTNTIFAA